MDDDEDNNRKGTVEVGSGDFQPNPIYGDQPQSYADTYEDDPNQMNNVQQDQYPQNPDEQQYEDDNDSDQNNPFNPNDGTQQQQQQQYDQQQYDQQQYGTDPQQQQQQQTNQYEQQQNPPPPYSEDPPAPPAYSDQTQQQQQQQYDNDPEDVVAQMNNDHNGDEDVGDYGVTQPKTEDDTAADGDGENGIGLFGNFFIRTITIASGLLWCSMLSFDIWFRDAGGDFAAGYGLSGFAAFMLFMGSIGAMVYAIMKKMGRPIPAENIVLWVIIAFYGIGGLFYFLGGCAVAYAWNEVDADYIAGIFFAEQTFVGLHGVVAGVDLWRRKILNNKKWRVLIYNIAFIFVSVVAFFAYAVTSTTIDDAGGDNAGPAFLALFYFLVLIPEILYLVVFLIPKLNETIGKPIFLLIMAGVFLLCVIMLLIGYFILLGEGAGFDGSAYFLGIGVFILITGSIIAFDMMFDRFIPGYKDGGQSVSDQEATSGPSAVATDNPDSD